MVEKRCQKSIMKFDLKKYLSPNLGSHTGVWGEISKNAHFGLKCFLGALTLQKTCWGDEKSLVAMGKMSNFAEKQKKHFFAHFWHFWLLNDPKKTISDGLWSPKLPEVLYANIQPFRK